MIKANILSRRLVVILFLLLILPLFAQAQTSDNVCTQGLVPCGQITTGADGQRIIANPCTLCHVPQLALNIIQFLFICIIPVIALIAIVGAGITIMVSGGSPALQSRAKSILKNTIIGLVIAYGAWLLVDAFLTVIGVADWTGLSTWFQLNITCGG